MDIDEMELAKISNNADYKIEYEADISFELSDQGYLKAQNLLDFLLSQPEIAKKSSNVIPCLSNLLVNGNEIEKAYYDNISNEILIYFKKTKYKVVMLGINEEDDIIMADNIDTYEEAKEILSKVEQEDTLHYFRIKEI